MSHETLENLCRAAKGVGGTPMARVTSHDPKGILRTLDAGAVGVMVPQVDTPEQAREVALAVRYGPEGQRSISSLTPAARWGTMTAQAYMAAANRAVFCVVQVESVLGVENCGAIARVPGVDMVFVGPSDLARSMGYPGRPDLPEVRAMVARAVSAAKEAGCKVGTVGRTPAQVREMRALGVDLFLASAGGMVLQAATRAVAEAREVL